MTDGATPSKKSEIQHVSLELKPSARKTGAVDLQAAEEYRRDTCPHKKLEDGTLVQYPLRKFKLEEFCEFGVGVYLYFRFLKRLSYVFMLLTIISLPLILTCIFAKQIPVTGFGFEQATVGNMGPSNTTHIEINESVGPQTVSLNLDKRDAGAVFSLIDVVGALILGYFFVTTRSNQKRIAQEADDSVTTAADYAVRVTNLPIDCYSRQELQWFFSIFGPVADVAICYNDTNIIRKHIDKSDIIGDIESAKAREKAGDIPALQKKLEKVDAKILKMKTKLSKHTVCAYVTFETESAAEKCIATYSGPWYSRLFMKKRFKFRGKHKLLVKWAPEPSEIIYDNMHYSPFNKNCRRMITFVLAFVAIGVSCGIILGASMYRNQTLGQEAVTCPVIDDINAIDASTLTGDDLTCYCSQLAYDQLYEKQDVCNSYLRQTLISNGLVAASSVIVVIVNVALRGISRMLVLFEKHSSITRMERELTWKMFVGLFFNTGLTILVINANTEPHFGVSPGGNYSDFSTGWYTVVGSALLLTMIMNTVNPHVIPVMTLPCMYRSHKKAKKAAHTQRELIEAIEGEEFTLAERYAVICNTVWVAYFYSSGMPILLPIAAFTLGLTYQCDKITLLRRCKYPPKYNIDVAQMAMDLLKPAVVIHLVISTWVYGSPTIFTSYPLNNSTASSLADSTRLRFMNRALNYNGILPFTIMAAVVGFTVVKNVLNAFKLTACAKRILRILCCCCIRCCCKSGNKIVSDGLVKPFSQEIKAGTRLESYLTSKQAMYEDAYVEGSGLVPETALYAMNPDYHDIKRV